MSQNTGLMGRRQQQGQEDDEGRCAGLSVRLCVGDFGAAGVFVVLYDSYECPFVNKQTEDTWLGPRMHFSASPLLCLNYIS